MRTLKILACWLCLSVFCSACWMRTRPHPEARRLNDLAARALAAGRLDKAQAQLEISLEYNPCYAPALHNQALLALLRRDLDGAEAWERQALACDPLVQAVNGLGVIALERQGPEAALVHFRRALALDPGYVDARRNLILCLLRLRRFREARRSLRRLQALVPGDAWARRQQGRLPAEPGESS